MFQRKSTSHSLSDLSHSINNDNNGKYPAEIDPSKDIEDEQHESNSSSSAPKRKKTPPPAVVIEPTPKKAAAFVPPPVIQQQSNKYTIPPKKKDAPSPAGKPVESKDVIIRKISEYLNSPSLKHLFSEKERRDWEPDHASAWSEARLNTFLDNIRSRIKSQFRLRMTETMFQGICSGAERFMVDFLHMDHMQDLGKAAMTNKHLFDEELAEIAIEMGEELIPSPKFRLMLKLAQFGADYHAARIMAVPLDQQQQQQQEKK